MSKNWGRTPITNADKRFAKPFTYIVETDNGPMQRSDRRPLGVSERFVNARGAVVQHPLYGEGDTRKADTEARNRMAAHRKGMIEHGKCPLRHGLRQFAPRDFAAMPKELDKECPSDPRPFVRLNYSGEPAARNEPGDWHARESCPHIEWLIKYRCEQAAKADAVVNPHVVEAARQKAAEAELKAAQLEMVKEQLAERKSRKVKKGDGE